MLYITCWGMWLKLHRALVESIQALVKAELLLFDTEHASRLHNVDIFVCTKGIKCVSLYAHLNVFL